jgi:hypothetical protein
MASPPSVEVAAESVGTVAMTMFPFATSPKYEIVFGVLTVGVPDTVAASTSVKGVTPGGDWLRKTLAPAAPSAIAVAVDPAVSTKRSRADVLSLPVGWNVKM